MENGVNKQNTHTHTHTHTHQTLRKITLEGVSIKISDNPFLKTTSRPPYFTNPSLFVGKMNIYEYKYGYKYKIAP